MRATGDSRDFAMTVNLTRIYTKLGDMSRVSKLHPRVEAYGTVDELNATIGVALLQPAMPEQFVDWLRRVQNDLLDVGADLSVPSTDSESEPVAAHDDGGGATAPTRARLRVGSEYTSWLEHARAAALVRDPGRDPSGGAPAHLPHGLPPSGAPHDRGGRGGQSRGGPLSE
jgi:hypothetical protein